MLLKKVEGEEKAEWTQITSSRKSIGSTDEYILGHPDVKLPAVILRCNISGVKARLVTIKDGMIGESNKVTPLADRIRVIDEWVFDKDDESKTIWTDTIKTFNKDVWVEMLNPTDKDAVVNAIINGAFKSKNRI